MVKNGGIVCNNGIEYSGIDLITTSALSDVTAIIAEYDVIGVFESQFFEDILVVDDWANAGKIIICDGLDADFRRDSFGRLAQLIPKCEDVIKLKAICERCQLDASFTQRIGVSTELIDVGGADKYIPVCRKCYITPAPSV
jgi:thymidine kinase